MPMKSKFYAIAGAVQGLLIGSLAATKAAAVSMMPAASTDPEALAPNWQGLRDELGGKDEPLALRAELMDILNMSDLELDLERAVQTSYAIARGREVEALDTLWVETLITRGDSQHMAQYLALRAALDIGPAQGAQSYLDWWLWDARGGPGGGCDGGNPGNDKDVGGSGEDPNDSGDFGDGNTGQQD